MDDARALLDSLMGQARNDSGDQKRTTSDSGEGFKSDSVCKLHLVGFCPEHEELFHNTRRDLGTCPKTHYEVHKRQFNEHPEKERYQAAYELQLFRHVESILRQCDEWTIREKQKNEDMLRAKKSSAGDGGGEVHRLKQKASEYLNEAEELASRGDIEASKSKVAEAQRHEKMAAAECEDKAIWTPSVCDICGGIKNGDKRAFKHEEGKVHKGVVLMKSMYKDLKEKNARGELRVDSNIEKEERDIKEREAKERRARERETRDREAKERRAREREAKEREANEREQRERESRENRARPRQERSRSKRRHDSQEKNADGKTNQSRLGGHQETPPSSAKGFDPADLKARLQNAPSVALVQEEEKPSEAPPPPSAPAPPSPPATSTTRPSLQSFAPEPPKREPRNKMNLRLSAASAASIAKAEQEDDARVVVNAPSEEEDPKMPRAELEMAAFATGKSVDELATMTQSKVRAMVIEILNGPDDGGAGASAAKEAPRSQGSRAKNRSRSRDRRTRDGKARSRSRPRRS